MEQAVRLLLLLILFMLPFAYWEVQAGAIAGAGTIYTVPKFYPLEILIAGTFVAWMGLRQPNRQALARYWPVAGLVALAFISAVWAPLPTLAVVIAAHLAIASLLLVMLASEFADPPFRRLASVVLVTMITLQAAWGGAQYLGQHDLGLQSLGEGVLHPPSSWLAMVPTPHGPKLRAYGVLTHPNVLAAYLAAAIFLVISALFARRFRTWWWQLAGGGLLGGLALAFLVTFSRTPWLVVTAGAMALLARGVWLVRRLPAGVMLAALIFAIGAFGVRTELQQRTSATHIGQVAVPDRAVQHEAAWTLVRQQPYGVGAGNYAPAVDEARPDLTPYQRQPVHDTIVLVTAELGIVGAGLLLFFVGSVLWDSTRAAWRRRAVWPAAACALLLASLGMTLTDHFFWTLPQGMWLFVVVLALAIAAATESAPQDAVRRKR